MFGYFFQIYILQNKISLDYTVKNILKYIIIKMDIKPS